MAVGAQEVDHEHVRRVAVRGVDGDVGHHRVLHEALGEQSPLALALEREAGRFQLVPDRADRVGLEHALILEEGQVEGERGRVARGRPIDGGDTPAGGGRAIVQGGGRQQRARVVDRIAGEVLGAACRPVQHVVADDAVTRRSHAGYQAHVRGPRRAREDRRHAVGDGAALGERPESRRSHVRIAPVEVGEAVDRDQEDERRAQRCVRARSMRSSSPSAIGFVTCASNPAARDCSMSSA